MKKNQCGKKNKRQVAKVGRSRNGKAKTRGWSWVADPNDRHKNIAVDSKGQRVRVKRT